MFVFVVLMLLVGVFGDCFGVCCLYVVGFLLFVFVLFVCGVVVVFVMLIVVCVL